MRRVGENGESRVGESRVGEEQGRGESGECMERSVATGRGPQDCSCAVLTVAVRGTR